VKLRCRPEKGEQRFNAEPTVAAGGGLLVRDNELTPAWLAAEVTALLTDSDRLATMGEAAAALGRRDADDQLVRMVRRAIETRGAPAADGKDVGGR
jgi:UDP-N-acetylglucosamine--N-acetylmuramyl-(pentapeptide) pyrophosphoryl-undecaprenol N-acetylglucosamine transferase